MAVDFRNLTSKPLDDVKRPPSLPQGTYYGRVTKYAWAESRFADKETGQKHGVVVYTLSIDRAGEDVEQARLSGIDLSKRQLSREMPIEGDNAWVTKAFIESLGISTAGRTFAEVVPEAVSQNVMYEVTERPNTKDPDGQPFNDVRSLRAAA